MSNFFYSRFSISLITILCLCTLPRHLSAATVSGTVSDSTSGAPITDGYIDLVIDAPCSDPVWEDWAVLDSSGNYTFEDLPAGTYYLRTDVSAAYLTEWWADTASTPLCEGAQSFTVTSEEIVSGKDFQLDTGSTISGTLYDESSNPIAGGYVEIFSEVPCSNPEYIDYAIVDSVGQYTFTALAPGTYYLRSDTEGNFLNEWWASSASSEDCLLAGQIEVGTDETIINRDFQLGPGATISGTVTDDGGNAVSSKYIRAYIGDPCGENVFLTGAGIAENGTYTIVGLLDDTYFLRTNLDGMHPDEWWDDPTSSTNCLDAEPIVVAPQETVVGKDFQLNFITISGIVYDNAENPITDGFVKVYTGQPCGTNVNVDTVSLDSSGNYSTQHLSPGDYYLQAVPNTNHYDEWWNASASSRECADAQVITVPSDTPVVDRDFQLDPILNIFGTVYDDTGAPLSSGEVDIYTGDPCGTKTRVTSASLDSNGNYSSQPLSSGNYYLLTDTDNTDHVDEWWADPASSTDCSAAEAVTLESAELTTPTNFQIDRTATIAGTVDDQAGAPRTNKVRLCEERTTI